MKAYKNFAKAKFTIMAFTALLILASRPVLTKTTQVAPGTGTLNEAVAAAEPNDVL